MLSGGHLDVRVSRSTSTNVFTNTIYRKPTFTGLMNKWNSFVSLSDKKASVVSMIQHYCHLNGYPRSFVDTRIAIGLTKYRNKNNNEESNLPVAGCEKQRLFVEVLLIGEQTDLMKKKIQHLTESIHPDLYVRFVAKPPRTVETFFPTKDPVPKHLQSNTVYAATCKECGDTYVGMTKRQTVARLCEHGAPKDTFDRKTNNIVNGVQPITVQQQTRSSRNTTIEPKAKQQEPSLRRSSRIRNQTVALATMVTNTNDVR